MAVQFADRFGEGGLPDGAFLAEALCLGVPACVGGGAVPEVDSVHHPVPVEEVMPGDRLEEGIGAVADVDAVDERRDATLHREIVGRGVLVDWGEITGDLDGRIGSLGQRVWPLEHFRYETLLDFVQGGRRQLLE